MELSYLCQSEDNFYTQRLWFPFPACMNSNPILADPRLVMLGPESSGDEYDDTMRGSDSQPTTTNQHHHQQCMVSTINYSSYHNSLSVALSCNLSVSVAYCSWLGMSLA